jgi:hypothetical protein
MPEPMASDLEQLHQNPEGEAGVTEEDLDELDELEVLDELRLIDPSLFERVTGLIDTKTEAGVRAHKSRHDAGINQFLESVRNNGFGRGPDNEFVINDIHLAQGMTGGAQRYQEPPPEKMPAKEKAPDPPPLPDPYSDEYQAQLEAWADWRADQRLEPVRADLDQVRNSVTTSRLDQVVTTTRQLLEQTAWTQFLDVPNFDELLKSVVSRMPMETWSDDQALLSAVGTLLPLISQQRNTAPSDAPPAADVADRARAAMHRASGQQIGRSPGTPPGSARYDETDRAVAQAHGISLSEAAALGNEDPTAYRRLRDRRRARDAQSTG